MEIERKFKPLEIKDVEEDGSFEGIAAVFGEVDHDEDVFDRGAFTDTIKQINSEQPLPMLWFHNVTRPVGSAAEVRETDRGLELKGSLVLESEQAREAHAFLKRRVIRGLSVGFAIKSGGAYTDTEGIRHLTDVELWETSFVAFPAQPSARVTGVKTAESVRDFETFLREVGGFSRRDAKTIASSGFKALARERDASDELVEVQRGLNNLLKEINKCRT